MDSLACQWFNTEMIKTVRNRNSEQSANKYLISSMIKNFTSFISYQISKQLPSSKFEALLVQR
jgi:hypothetical protein